MCLIVLNWNFIVIIVVVVVIIKKMMNCCVLKLVVNMVLVGKIVGLICVKIVKISVMVVNISLY